MDQIDHAPSLELMHKKKEGVGGVYVNVRGVGEGVGVIISQGHSSFPNEATFMEFHPRLSYLALHATYQQL